MFKEKCLTVSFPMCGDYYIINRNSELTYFAANFGKVFRDTSNNIGKESASVLPKDCSQLVNVEHEHSQVIRIQDIVVTDR
jgi:hypothetical protein